jgi:uncharacterized membrane protein YcaP (DUF421 family)
MFIKIILLSLFALSVLFIIAKLIGNKQISQLGVFDYIIGITIGNIAAEMATGLSENWYEPLTALLVFGIASCTISFICTKSIKMRRLLWGKPLVLYHNGDFFGKNLFKAKLDVSEFQMICRTSGYFNLADIGTAVLEPNGKISLIPVAAKKPLMSEDLNLYPKQEEITANIIIDGKVLEPVLKQLGKNKIWLNDQLNAQGFGDIKEIQLATYDTSGDVSIYRKIKKPETKNLFE